ncbi:hypothetical protein SUGI_1227960 [Cryptomeria japonica]|uniref:Uncharacterized protein n=1 Tax=Cryptomeria japonica TaxID=3369 RepID=A0AAD3NMZ0_CRYJA|nr:hypothetical protein SUGI_1227960 [Cryptomeria japonica]
MLPEDFWEVLDSIWGLTPQVDARAILSIRRLAGYDSEGGIQVERPKDDTGKTDHAQENERCFKGNEQWAISFYNGAPEALDPGVEETKGKGEKADGKGDDQAIFPASDDARVFLLAPQSCCRP